ncbi:hypothetical protein Bca52824_013874 [Brassica carinata]|uniref:Uncharacterized protein n=1 Tax=Brassica carinata TaxID=52824 RepID=A0A8X7VZB0_BRACI|nr:hypothetical protein Bca52824_013874 [Brassica carinata]
MRPSGSGMKAVVRSDRDTRFWEENRDYLESSVRVNEAVQIRDHNETYIQHRKRDAELQKRRNRETESVFFQQKKKNREYEWSGSRVNEAGPISGVIHTRESATTTT